MEIYNEKVRDLLNPGEKVTNSMWAQCFWFIGSNWKCASILKLAHTLKNCQCMLIIVGYIMKYWPNFSNSVHSYEQIANLMEEGAKVRTVHTYSSLHSA